MVVVRAGQTLWSINQVYNFQLLPHWCGCQKKSKGAAILFYVLFKYNKNLATYSGLPYLHDQGCFTPALSSPQHWTHPLPILGPTSASHPMHSTGLKFIRAAAQLAFAANLAGHRIYFASLYSCSGKITWHKIATRINIDRINSWGPPSFRPCESLFLPVTPQAEPPVFGHTIAGQCVRSVQNSNYPLISGSRSEATVVTSVCLFPS